MKALGIITAALATIIASTIWRGYCAACLWAWFAVPIFGLPRAGIAAMIGISSLVDILAKPYPDVNEDKKPTKDFIVKGIATAFGTPAIILLIGFIAKQFI